MRTIPRWSPCEVDSDDEDGPVFQGFLTDENGAWVKWEDVAPLLAALPKPVTVDEWIDGKAPDRWIESPFARDLPREDRLAFESYHRALLHDRQAGDHLRTREALAAIREGRRVLIPGYYWTNECCICHARGAVVNYHAHSPACQLAIVIDWKCKVCQGLVCINCTLVIPRSKPARFYDTTYCSRECWITDGASEEEL